LNGLTVAPVHLAREEAWNDFLKRVDGLAISELMIIDRKHVGAAGSSKLSELVPVAETLHKLIWFGGLSATQAAELLKRPDTVGVAFGNPFLVNELAVNTYRNDINEQVRPQLLRKVRPHVG
jgi:hypothetical protein